MKNDVDKSTLLEAKNGNLIAFERILMCYEKPVLNYIYRLVGQKQDAEDLMQETFLKVYKNIGNLDTEAKFSSWVFTIATNVTYDWMRKKKMVKEISFDVDLSDIFAHTDATLVSASHARGAETSFDVSRALSQLKPVHRTVLNLFYYQGFSYDDIANILSVPINTVKTHLSRAKVALKEILHSQENYFNQKPAMAYNPKKKYGLHFSEN